jgi:hypothetical protein
VRDQDACRQQDEDRQTMTDASVENGPPVPADEPADNTRDYIKALAWIALIVGIVVLVFWIGIGGLCGCGTRGPG